MRTMDSAAGTALTSADCARIVLNRLAYGPRPGDVDRVVSMGVMRWVNQQLDPGRDRARATLESQFRIQKLHREDLARRFVAEREARRQAKADSMAAANDPAVREFRELEGEFQQLAAARAVMADNQLEEVLSDFWINHFNVFLGKGADRFLLPSYVEETIRPRVLGRFEDLLIATAESPAMMVYLDNTLSVAKGAIPPQLARAEMRSLRWYSPRADSAIARILTGWGIDPPERGAGFTFRDWAHDDGEKHVLGVRFRAGRGRGEGDELLRMLARHPATMLHVTTQLCQRFIGDDPPAATVEAGVLAWKHSHGSVREVVRAIVVTPEFWATAGARAKFKTPLEFVVSSIRAVGGTVGTDPGPAHAIARLGEPLYQQPVPTGYVETSMGWANSAALFERMNVAVQLAAGRLPGVDMDLETLVPISDDPDSMIDRVDRALLSGEMSPHAREVIRQQVEGLPPQQARALAVGLGLGGPDFQQQ